VSAAELAARIPDGALLALAPDYSGCAMAVVCELVRRGARGLRLLGVPQLGLQADILIGASCVAEVETAAVSLGEHGLAPCFLRAAAEGRLVIRDSTCPAIHAALTATERGIPFMPLAGVLGSDLVRHRPDWQVIASPFAPGDPILLVPAIRPDVALFHAELADAEGNVWVGVRRELMTMAHAAATTLVSVEERRAGSLLADPALAAGTLPGLYVGATAVIRGGARPLACGDRYPADQVFLARYAELAATPEGFARFLAAWLADG
jgi:glutaconate CoA-transferase subunit A